jgi:hypothetical protein
VRRPHCKYDFGSRGRHHARSVALFVIQYVLRTCRCAGRDSSCLARRARATLSAPSYCGICASALSTRLRSFALNSPAARLSPAAVVLCVATLVIFVKRQTSVTSPQMSQTSGTIPAPSTVSRTQQDGAQDELAFVVLLSPEVSRGADAHSSFAIPGNVRFVEFQIVLSATKEKTRYEVSVSSETRKEPLIVSDLEPKSLGAQRYLEFRALAGSLPPGKYSVFVSAETKGRPLQARYDLSLTQSPRRPLP